MIIKSKKLIIEDYVLIEYLCQKSDLYYFKSELYSNNEMIDYSKTMPITDSMNIANTIYSILINNKVFPCHLNYIADDVISNFLKKIEKN